jgi:MtN3 and saliva related transmembrane protein
MTTLVIWIGYAAGTLTTLAFLPQVLHTWKTKRAEDLHIGTLVSFTVGIALWLVYGIVRQDAPVFLANAVTLALQLAIIALKLKYAKAGRRGTGRG